MTTGDKAARTTTVLGVPHDASSSYLRGAAKAPAAIRRALHGPSTNLTAECGLDLGADDRWSDAGDLELPADPTALAAIETAAADHLAGGARLIALGGDHAVTYPLVRAHAAVHSGLEVLHLDAHPDLYDVLDGDRFSHACPFARIMEEGLVGRLVQVGIRAMNPHQREQADRFGVEVHEMCRGPLSAPLRFTGPVYLSLDLDCLDPAFAPGVSHREPGGLSVRDVIGIIQRFEGRLIGADIVEYNPDRDRDGVTAMVAAKLLKEILARVLD